RVRDSARPEVLAPAGILFQLPLAAEDGLPDTRNHLSIAAAVHTLQLSRFASDGSAPRSLLRQTLVLFVGMRLRRPRQYSRRALSASDQQVQRGVEIREDRHPLRARHLYRSYGVAVCELGRGRQISGPDSVHVSLPVPLRSGGGGDALRHHRRRTLSAGRNTRLVP